MHTTIKASCPYCGDVDLTPAQVRLVACSVTDWSYYTFICPKCKQQNRKPASREIALQLIRGGVVAEHWVIPAEVFEEKAGPPINHDDVLDCALWLDSVDLVAAAAQASLGIEKLSEALRDD